MIEYLPFVTQPGAASRPSEDPVRLLCIGRPDYFIYDVLKAALCDSANGIEDVDARQHIRRRVCCVEHFYHSRKYIVPYERIWP